MDVLLYADCKPTVKESETLDLEWNVLFNGDIHHVVSEWETLETVTTEQISSANTRQKHAGNLLWVFLTQTDAFLSQLIVVTSTFEGFLRIFFSENSVLFY